MYVVIAVKKQTMYRVYDNVILIFIFFFFSSRRRHTRCSRDWSSDVCSSDLCNLYIPDFFSAEGFSSDSLAAAETLIARGRRKRIALISAEAWLFERFGVPKQRDWPVAPYTLLAAGGAPERHYWMRAGPVHLR